MKPKVNIYDGPALVSGNTPQQPIDLIESDLTALCLVRRYDINRIDVYLNGNNGGKKNGGST